MKENNIQENNIRKMENIQCEVKYKLSFTCLQCTHTTNKLSDIFRHINGLCKQVVEENKITTDVVAQVEETTEQTNQTVKESLECLECKDCSLVKKDLEKEKGRVYALKKLFDIYCLIDINKIFLEADGDFKIIDPVGNVIMLDLNGNVKNLPLENSIVITATNVTNVITDVIPITDTQVVDVQGNVQGNENIEPPNEDNISDNQTKPKKPRMKKIIKKNKAGEIISETIVRADDDPSSNVRKQKRVVIKKTNETINETSDSINVTPITKRMTSTIIGPIEKEENIQTPVKQVTIINKTPKYKTPRIKTPKNVNPIIFSDNQTIEYPFDEKNIDGIVDFEGKLLSKYKKVTLSYVNKMREESALVNKDEIEDIDTYEKSYMEIDDVEFQSKKQAMIALMKEVKDGFSKAEIFKILDTIREIRYNLLGNIHISKYVDLLKNHIDNLQSVLRRLKVCRDSESVMKEYLYRSLTPIDKKFLRIGNYTDYDIDCDTASAVRRSATIRNIHKIQFIPFSNKYIDIARSFVNDSLKYYTVGDIARKLIFNKYGFSNLIYVPLKSSTNDDPYSFYYLVKTVNGKRYWSIDHRLESFAYELYNVVRPQCIEMFKFLYHDCFGDHQYRLGFQDLNVTLKKEGQQLLENICLLSNLKNLCEYLQNMVINQSTFIPTDNDYFDTFNDNSEQKNNFKSPDYFDCNVKSELHSMFSQFSIQDLEDFILHAKLDV